MNPLDSETAPHPQESLADYLRRVRTHLGLSQQEVAMRAGIHLQSVGKLERGITVKLNRKTRSGLAYALHMPVEYLQAVERGEDPVPLPAIKFCPHCWIPGTPPESGWTEYRAKYCFLCGTALRHQCRQCHEPIVSLKHRFCPYCGTTYKSS